MKYIDITVIQKPVKISFICPNCSEEIETNYNDFVDTQINDYPGDWSTTEGPECEATFHINNVEYDQEEGMKLSEVIKAIESPIYIGDLKGE